MRVKGQTNSGNHQVTLFGEEGKREGKGGREREGKGGREREGKGGERERDRGRRERERERGGER